MKAYWRFSGLATSATWVRKAVHTHRVIADRRTCERKRRRDLRGSQMKYTTVAATPILLALAAITHAQGPAPLLKSGEAVDWWFVFKFNAKSFPGCGGRSDAHVCPFGGEPQDYKGG